MASSDAPFRLPVGAGNIKAGGTFERRNFPPGLSDGQKTRWPGAPYRPSDERNYLVKLAQAWAERDGSAKPGVVYYLEKLPDGYGCFEMDQPDGIQIYKRLFGHPSGRFYDSIVRFQTHFFWLLDGKKDECLCALCGNHKHVGPPRKRNRLDPILDMPFFGTSVRQNRRTLPTQGTQSGDDASSRSESVGDMIRERTRRPTRGVQVAHPTDEEGTFDVYRDALKTLHTHLDSTKDGFDIDLIENDSIDWYAEREPLPEYLTRIELQHSFVPRRGELVLWCPNLPQNQYILRDPSMGQHRLFDFATKKFTGFPEWRAGVVADVPSAASKNGSLDFPDILENHNKQTSVNTAGFRIETMPDPNNDNDKSLSKQYRYVYLRNIRPLSHWQHIMNGIAQKSFHRSILYALSCMTSVSALEKTKIIGHWKHGAQIHARACYIGSELITIGDTIRLSPEPPSATCTDVLVVNSIRVKLDGFKLQHLESMSPLLCSSVSVHFLGRAYTLDPLRQYDPTQQGDLNEALSHLELDDVKEIFRPVGSAEFGKWYPLHSIHKKLDVSYDQVLGRLYEADALRLWSGQRLYKPALNPVAMKPDLNYDTAGIIAARRYATKTDERIPELPPEEPNGIRWLLSDHRAQALDIAMVNGLETAAYYYVRTPTTMQAWRNHIKIANGEAPVHEAKATRGRPSYTFGIDAGELSSAPTKSGVLKARGRPPGSKLIDGKLWTAEMLAGRKDLSNMKEDSQEAEVHDNDDVNDEEEQDDQNEIRKQYDQPVFKHSSHMASAAIDSDDDILDDSKHDQSGHRRPTKPIKSRLAAYGGTDIDSDIDPEEDENGEQEEEEDDMEDIQVAGSSRTKPRQERKPPSKSQIMESVEVGHDNALENVQEYEAEDGDDDADSLASLYLEDWKDPRNARGGTESSDGGDYRPGETQ